MILVVQRVLRCRRCRGRRGGEWQRGYSNRVEELMNQVELRRVQAPRASAITVQTSAGSRVVASGTKNTSSLKTVRSCHGPSPCK